MAGQAHRPDVLWGAVAVKDNIYSLLCGVVELWSTTCEVHCEGQVDEGEVVVQVELAPARVSEEVGRDNLGNDFKEC